MSDDRPLVSVVSASLNVLADLRLTVTSVASQQFPLIEHVIVDGGSGDGTCDYLAGLGPSVRWISEPDKGIADAMNKGFAMARGAYVIVLQAGDTFTDRASVARVAGMLGEGADLVACAVRFDRARDSIDVNPRGLSLLSGVQMTMPHQGLFCRRDLFERIGGFDGGFRIAMDYEFLLRARNASASVLVSDEVVAVMPATGISSRTDWRSVSERLCEFRAAQRRHLRGRFERLLNRVYWALYLPYKRVAVALGK